MNINKQENKEAFKDNLVNPKDVNPKDAKREMEKGKKEYDPPEGQNQMKEAAKKRVKGFTNDMNKTGNDIKNATKERTEGVKEDFKGGIIKNEIQGYKKSINTMKMNRKIKRLDQTITDINSGKTKVEKRSLEDIIKEQKISNLDQTINDINSGNTKAEKVPLEEAIKGQKGKEKERIREWSQESLKDLYSNFVNMVEKINNIKGINAIGEDDQYVITTPNFETKIIEAYDEQKLLVSDKNKNESYVVNIAYFNDAEKTEKDIPLNTRPIKEFNITSQTNGQWETYTYNYSTGWNIDINDAIQLVEKVKSTYENMTKELQEKLNAKLEIGQPTN